MRASNLFYVPFIFLSTTLLASAIFVGAMFLTSCPSGQTGTIRIVITPQFNDPEPSDTSRSRSNHQRTILPTIQAHGYRLRFNGPSSTDFVVETSDTVIEQNLGVGEWSISAEALDASSRTIAAGAVTGVAVNAVGTSQITIPLSPGMVATGYIDITLTWPADLGHTVETISGTLGGTAIPLSDITFNPLTHSARYSSTQASGSYRLEFDLAWGEYSIKPVLEAVHVYDYLLTSKIFQTDDYFKPPVAPSELSVHAGTQSLILSWVDNSAVETGFEIQRSLDGTSWFDLLTEPLPENTAGYTDATAESGVAYSYRVRAINAFGASDYYTTSEIIKKIIDHTNYDPTALSNEAIAAAATLRVYFEHASVGNDIVGDSDVDSSTGGNFDGSADCGLALLHDSPNGTRYLCGRETYYETNSASWYTTHTGLQTNNRSNPPTPIKLSGFLGLSAAMQTAVDVAMFKFCWIDGIDGNIPNGATFAADLIDDIEAFEAENPGLIVPYWTMPIQTNESFQTREDYNNAIRTYCAENGKWLLDIADLECHNAAGIKRTDGDGREIMYDEYAVRDGGHLATAGRLKLAQAYWTLIAGIAAELAE
jgi:hypothetical protein